ncbi:MAG: IS91 family transposase [Candidatus Scalindua sp.]
MKAQFELADIIRRFGKALVSKDNLTLYQIKTLHKLMQCRTASLGGHEEQCDCCGEVRYSYNSCGDRHCPKCQAAKQAVWIEHLLESTLPVKHYHIVFTVPHCLNKICLFNDREFYRLLFSAVWRTLHSFGYTHYGVESGAVCVLHTWGQNLSLHPHVHCIVPAAGYSLSGKWKHIGTFENYLYPVHQLSKTFRGKFLDSLKRWLKKDQVLAGFDTFLQKAWKTKWVVFCEPSMANAEHVVRYLGQYTHRVAISNQRLLNISDTHVTFITKDYRDKAIKKPTILEGVEFLRRFCMHILPRRFVKIRRYGIYNHTTKHNLELQFKPEEKADIVGAEKKPKKETAQERIYRLTGFDVYQCPKCKKGIMHTIRELPRIRSPGGYSLSSFKSLLL